MKLKKIFTTSLVILLALGIMTSCAENIEKEKKIGYISNINVQEKSFDFDEIEWITSDDTKRAEELGLDVQEDFPNGFHVNDPSADKKSCQISDKATFQFIDWKDNFKAKASTFEEFVNQYNEFFATFQEPVSTIPYWIELENDIVISIEQQYTP